MLGRPAMRAAVVHQLQQVFNEEERELEKKPEMADPALLEEVRRKQDQAGVMARQARREQAAQPERFRDYVLDR